MELKDILRRLKADLSEVGMSVTDEVMLDCAVRMLNTNSISNGKPSDPSQTTIIAMASSKQKNYLKSLGFKGSIDGLNSKEASAAIEELK